MIDGEKDWPIFIKVSKRQLVTLDGLRDRWRARYRMRDGQRDINKKQDFFQYIKSKTSNNTDP